VITAVGGPDRRHPWRWKFELARLATATGLDIIVCYCPPGTRKWNRIEHKLFSRIIYNRRGSLVTYQVTVTLIAHTARPASPTFHCKIDVNFSLTKIELTDQQKKSIPLARHQFRGDWNYIIRPSNRTSQKQAEPRWPRHPLADRPARHAPSWPAPPPASAERTEIMDRKFNSN
jgi:hypothetical protein